MMSSVPVHRHFTQTVWGRVLPTTRPRANSDSRERPWVLMRSQRKRCIFWWIRRDKNAAPSISTFLRPIVTSTHTHGMRATISP